MTHGCHDASADIEGEGRCESLYKEVAMAFFSFGRVGEECENCVESCMYHESDSLLNG